MESSSKKSPLHREKMHQKNKISKENMVEETDVDYYYELTQGFILWTSLWVFQSKKTLYLKSGTANSRTRLIATCLDRFLQRKPSLSMKGYPKFIITYITSWGYKYPPFFSSLYPTPLQKPIQGHWGALHYYYPKKWTKTRTSLY